MYFYCYVKVLLLLCVVFCIFCFHRTNWHSSATLTGFFRALPQLSGKCQGISRKVGSRPALFPLADNFYAVGSSLILV
jgi:hypothetical protein